MWGEKRQREGVVIHRRDSDGPLQGGRLELVTGHGMKIRWPSALQPPGNAGGCRQGSNEGVVTSGQSAVVMKGRSADLRCDKWYT
jgi:hypothetical protein